MTTTGTRTCPACGQPFTWTTASPRQKYCSTRCKDRWWNTRKRTKPTTTPATTTHDHGATAHDPGVTTTHDARVTTTHDPGVTPDAPAGNPQAAITATQACPHCRNPIAVVTWLITPAAARVPPPRDTPVTVSDNTHPER